jgi:PHD/YefM family antitoxin component YafN of YafNO toxin-antitoxin module
MKAKKQSALAIVLRDGKPAAVILDIEHYRELLERAEDAEDLRTLKAMRRRPLKFRRLDDFLKSYAPDA